MAKPLMIVRGDTVPIQFGPLEKKTASGTWVVPTFTGATPRLVITDPNGVVLYARTGAFTDVAAGLGDAPQLAGDFSGSGVVFAFAEVEVTYSGGAVESFPKGPAKHPVIISDDLD